MLGGQSASQSVSSMSPEEVPHNGNEQGWYAQMY